MRIQNLHWFYFAQPLKIVICIQEDTLSLLVDSNLFLLLKINDFIFFYFVYVICRIRNSTDDRFKFQIHYAKMGFCFHNFEFIINY